MNCIFCKIIKGEIPCKKIFENNNFIVILDAFPANEGHSLVIPKKHYKNMFETEDNILKEGYKIAKYIGLSLKKSFGAENINILQNNGSIAGQTVDHFHIHVIPRKEKDTVTFKSEIIDITEERKEEIKNKIIEKLDIDESILT